MVENEQEKKPEEPKNMSVLEETKAAITELKKEKEEIAEIKKEISELRSDQLLSGTAGVRGEAPKEMTEEQKRKEGAKEFFKGTQLEAAIDAY